MLGTFSGVFNSSRGFISLPAPWLGAQLWERIGPKAPFTVTSVAAFLIVIPVYLKFKTPDKPLDMTPPAGDPPVEPLAVETIE
jgi:hypothetical protein